MPAHGYTTLPLTEPRVDSTRVLLREASMTYAAPELRSPNPYGTAPASPEPTVGLDATAHAFARSPEPISVALRSPEARLHETTRP